MTYAVGFISKYMKSFEFERKVDAAVVEVCLMTMHGVGHFKATTFPRSVKCFADFDTGSFVRPEHASAPFQSRNRLELEKNVQYKRQRATTAKANSSPLATTFMEITSLEQFQKHEPHLWDAIQANPSALTVWKQISGESLDGPTGEEILGLAETITLDRMQLQAQEKAKAMADLDPRWGVF